LPRAGSDLRVAYSRGRNPNGCVYAFMQLPVLVRETAEQVADLLVQEVLP
jgi:hypothetical protein